LEFLNRLQVVQPRNVRRRLFEDIGGERTHRNVARAYADWRFERRARLPPEWTAADAISIAAKSRTNTECEQLMNIRRVFRRM
jgi:hypothetical protein